MLLLLAQISTLPLACPCPSSASLDFLTAYAAVMPTLSSQQGFGRALLDLCANSFCETLFLYKIGQSSASWNTESHHLSTVIRTLILSPKASVSSTHWGSVRWWGSFLPSLLLHARLTSLGDLTSASCTHSTQYSINQTNALQTI